MGACSSAETREVYSHVQMRRNATTNAVTPSKRKAATAANVVRGPAAAIAANVVHSVPNTGCRSSGNTGSRSSGNTGSRSGASGFSAAATSTALAAEAAQTLEQEEARQLKQFQTDVRRSAWVSGAVGAPLDGLAGLWLSEWSQESRRKRLDGAASSVAGALVLVNVVGRSETWSALALTDEQLAAGELCWQVNGAARTMTGFGLPGYEALLKTAPAAFGRCVLVVSGSGAERVLYFYVGKRCELRCWRRGAGDTAAPAAAPTAAATRSAASVGGGRHATTAQAASSRTAPETPGHQGGGARKRARSSSDLDPRAVQTKAAALVARWAAGRELPAMLLALAKDFDGVFDDSARGRLEQAHAAADGAVGPAVARQVKRAYHAACLQLHPDRHVASSPEVRTLAEELFKTISEAFVDYNALPGSPGLSC